MILTEKSRILATSKSAFESTVAVFFGFNIHSQPLTRLGIVMRPSNSGTLAALCDQVLLFDKNGRRWPLYINLNHKTMSKSNHNQGTTCTPEPFGNSEQLTIKKNRAKAIIENYLSMVDPKDSIAVLDQMYYLVMQCADIALEDDIRAAFAEHHLIIINLLKSIQDETKTE